MSDYPISINLVTPANDVHTPKTKGDSKKPSAFGIQPGSGIQANGARPTKHAPPISQKGDSLHKLSNANLTNPTGESRTEGCR